MSVSSDKAHKDFIKISTPIFIPLFSASTFDIQKFTKCHHIIKYP